MFTLKQMWSLNAPYSPRGEHMAINHRLYELYIRHCHTSTVCRTGGRLELWLPRICSFGSCLKWGVYFSRRNFSGVNTQTYVWKTTGDHSRSPMSTTLMIAIWKIFKYANNFIPALPPSFAPVSMHHELCIRRLSWSSQIFKMVLGTP